MTYSVCRCLVLLISLTAVCLSACASPRQPDRFPTLAVTLTSTKPPVATSITATPKRSTPTQLHPTISITPVPSPTFDATPHTLCQQPPDDYRHITFGAHTLNARTLWMLQLAQVLYPGRGDPLNVTQGSYVDTVAASFGTHAGGGAVDISVRVKDHPTEILDPTEMTDLVTALRQAGFAAWLRLPGDLSPSTAVHIHAIAIGDRELSDAARRQLDGPEGYFRGLNGIPPENGGTQPDRYGGPIVCDWMKDLGFAGWP